MNRIVPAILTWLCFLLIGCDKSQQGLYHGSGVITINDSIHIHLDGESELISNIGYYDSDHKNVPHTHFSLCQFDSSSQYYFSLDAWEIALWANHPFHFTHGDNDFEIFHPQISGHYILTEIDLLFTVVEEGLVVGHLQSPATLSAIPNTVNIKLEFEFRK